jgi:hypothetical protein
MCENSWMRRKVSEQSQTQNSTMRWTPMAIDRKRTPKAPSKAQAAVQKQIQQHRAKVKSGEKVAHVTPIVRNGEIRKVTVRVKKKKAP